MADKLLRFKDILEMDQKEPLADPRPLSFDDLHTTQYMPGEDELINYRAYRRKRTIGVGEGGPIGESTQVEGLFDRVGDKVAKAKRAIANGMPKHVAMAKYLVTSKDLGEETEVSEKAIKVCKDCGDEYNKPTTDCKNDSSDPDGSHWVSKSVDEALSVAQRLQRKRAFQRLQPKIKLGRERAKRKIASKEKLQKRAMKAARNAILKKLTKDIPKSELSFARRQELEKRLEKPAIKKRIAQIARKLYPKVRQAELAKKRGGSK